MRVLLAFAVVCLSACRAPLTEVVVVVHTDLQVPDAVDGVVVTVVGPRGEVERSVGALASRTQLPATVGLVHRNGPIGDVRVTVEGQRDGATVIERRASFAWIAGETRMLRMDLLEQCIGVTCGAEETCTETGCRPIAIDPSELLPYGRLDAGAIRRDAGGSDAATEGDGGVDAGRDGGRDAGVDAGPDGGAPTCDPGRTCGEQGASCTCAGCACRATCSSNCDVTCTNSPRCAIEAGTTSTFDLICEASTCEVRARSSQNTTVVCRDGARCTVDCMNASNCSVTCEGSSECFVRCQNASNCGFAACDAARSCGNGFACNRECP